MMALPPAASSTPHLLQHTTRLCGRTNIIASRKDPAAAADTLFGYSPGPPPEANQLTRDVWRWVQRMALSTPIRNPRRDIANGFLVAELLGRFYVRPACSASAFLPATGGTVPAPPVTCCVLLRHATCVLTWCLPTRMSPNLDVSQPGCLLTRMTCRRARCNCTATTTAPRSRSSETTGSGW